MRGWTLRCQPWVSMLGSWKSGSFRPVGVEGEVGEVGGAGALLFDVYGDDAGGHVGFLIDVDFDGVEFFGEVGAGLGDEEEVDGAGEVVFGGGGFGDVEAGADLGGGLADGEGEAFLAELEEVDFLAGGKSSYLVSFLAR